MSEQTGLRIGVIAETAARETTVSATPRTVAQLRCLGYDVIVESGAGIGSSFSVTPKNASKTSSLLFRQASRQPDMPSQCPVIMSGRDRHFTA